MLCTTESSAQTVLTSDSIAIYFRQGHSTLDLFYKDNGLRLGEFAKRYEALKADTTMRVGSVVVTGYASPEGTYQFNQRLSRNRAMRISEWLKSRLGMPDSLVVQQACGIDWQGLAEAIDTLRETPWRDTVLSIIRHVPEVERRGGMVLEQRKQQLLNLDGGRTWRYIYDNVFPMLRNSSARMSIITHRVEPDTPDMDVSGRMMPTQDTVKAEEPDTVQVEVPEITPVPRKMLFALRTNLLVPGHNFGFEVPIGRHWSVGGDYYYPWQWRKSDKKNCFQLIFFSAEARYWFKKTGERPAPSGFAAGNKLLGHSIGAYGVWGYYDFEHDYSGHQGDIWSAGLDYVYALPVFKGWAHFEFQLAVGYIYSKAHPYDVFEEGGHLINRRNVYKNFDYFGPTKVGVSLVIPITKKGGRR